MEIRQVFSPEFRLLILIGFLGGFTTFSTFGYETLQLLRDSQIAMALLYVGLQVLGSLVAVGVGFGVAKSL